MIDNFNTVWDNIGRCAGQTFATVTGQPFAYDVQEDGLAVRRSDLFLQRGDIERQFAAGGGKGHTAAYINAILRDNRIQG